MACMVCRKFDVRLFSVGSNYGNINHTVGDDLVEIYGEKVSVHLTPESCVCNACMNILDNIAKLIRNIWSLISNPCDQPQPGKLGKLWKIFASLKVDGDDIEECQGTLNRTPTPSKLMTLMFSEPYRSKQERKIAESERQRSLSRSTICCARSEVSSNFSDVNEISGDSEDNEDSGYNVDRKIVKRRRKRKGHNWTRPKRGRSRTSRASPTSDVSRFSSPISNYSSVSCRSNRRSPSKKKQTVEYDAKGRLTKKRTRSVSRAQEEEEKSKFYCREYKCQLYFYDVEVLNYHQISDHNLPALHYCDECQQRYTTAELLRKHVAIHDTSPLYCLMCSMGMKDRIELQEHLDEHMAYSIPCKCCDKSFLSKSTREEHMKKCHRGRKKRDAPDRRSKLIIDRFDSEFSETDNNRNNREDRDELTVVMIPYTDMELESDDLDVTEENMRLCNIEFFTSGDVQNHSIESETTSETEIMPESETMPEPETLQ
ncbi:unnamed protein product [Phaedon cochleariae]|uniref:C2H2-type domain-containing protein n=1 Tax=Phaedon cochleariae TaxID=80249 RepID=A0A9P0DVV5_PHACE|nr:unnamed protein product [Phaedon cochleariae]